MFLNNPKSYLRILNLFLEHQSNTPEKILDALNTGDRPLAHRLAHTLKGSAAFIGAESVRAAAADLEACLLDETGGVDAALVNLTALINPLCAHLRQTLPASEGKPKR